MTKANLLGQVWVATKHCKESWTWSVCAGGAGGGGSGYRMDNNEGLDDSLGAWSVVWGLWVVEAHSRDPTFPLSSPTPLLSTLITWAESLMWATDEQAMVDWRAGPSALTNAGAREIVASLSPGDSSDRPTPPPEVESVWTTRPSHSTTYLLEGRGEGVRLLRPARYLGNESTDGVERWVTGDIINRWLVGGEERWHIRATVAPTDLFGVGGKVSPQFREFRAIRWSAEWLLLPFQPTAMHWALLVLSRNECRGWILDGLRGSTVDLGAFITSGLCSSLEARHQELLADEEDSSLVGKGMRRWHKSLKQPWSWVVDRSGPCQGSNVDCGLWVILTALDIGYGRGWSFNQSNIEDRREEMGLRMGCAGDLSLARSASFTGTIDGVWRNLPRGVQEAPRPPP